MTPYTDHILVYDTPVLSRVLFAHHLSSIISVNTRVQEVKILQTAKHSQDEKNFYSDDFVVHQILSFVDNHFYL